MHANPSLHAMPRRLLATSHAGDPSPFFPPGDLLTYAAFFFFAMLLAAVSSSKKLTWRREKLVWFAAGVFLGTAMVDLLSEYEPLFHLLKFRYSLAFVLSCTGYVVAMLVDCILAYVVRRFGRECSKKSHPKALGAKIEVRQSYYKVAVDADEGQKRREEKKLESHLNSSSQIDKKLESLPNMVAGVWSEEYGVQLEATTQFRKLLSIENNPHIEEVIQAGVVPRLVVFLSRQDYPLLQFEAAWALTNIASGTPENTKFVVKHGVVPILVRLLSSPTDDVREQAIWALGNIAGDSPQFRDLVLDHGALIPLLAQFHEHAKLSMLRTATWTLSNFCRGKPQPKFEQTKPALPALSGLLYSKDENVLADACWALSYISDGKNDNIQPVIDIGVCPRLVKILLYPAPSVLVPALKALGNIVRGDDKQTQAIVDFQALPCLLNLLTSTRGKIIKKEACSIISKITAGNNDHIQAVIVADLIGPLVQLLQNAEFEIKKEAARAISNATFGGTHEQIKFLVSQGCIKPLCDLLVSPDLEIVIVCLKGLANILKVGEAEKSLGNTGDVNFVAKLIDEAEGLDKIENLKSRDNQEINELAVHILALGFPGGRNKPPVHLMDSTLVEG